MTMVLSKQNIWKTIKEYVLLVFGACGLSASNYFFILPCKVVSGGVGGLSHVLFYWFNWQVSVTSIVLQIPLLVMALIMLPKSFSIKTVFACVVYSVWMYLYETCFPFIPEYVPSSRILWLLAGAVVGGVGIYLSFIAGGSKGGSEIVSSIVVKKNPDAKIGNVLIIVNYVVYALALICFITTDGLNMECAIRLIYSILMSYAVSYVVDIVSNGIDPLLEYRIVTSKDEEIAKALEQVFKRGVSEMKLVDHRGKEKKRKMLRVVIQFRQNSKLKHIIKSIDPDCFAYCKFIDSVVTRPEFNKRYKNG